MEQRAEQTAPNTNANMQQADPSALMSSLAALQEKTRRLESFIQDNYAQLESGGFRRQDAAAAMSSILYELIAAGAAVLHSVQVGDTNSTALMSTAGPAPAKLRQDAVAISDVSKSVAVEAPSLQPQKTSTTSSSKKLATKVNASAEAVTESGYEIVEMNEDDILVEHTHFCEICGKGFRRDANVRMHMRAHGNEYKTPEALMANKEKEKDADKDALAAASSQRRYSCPFDKCRRNREHRKFKPLKSIASLRNHYKRSHCPKMYTCNKCGKHFSVVGDLKTHGKTCGHNRWRCSCGTTFTRKDKLFGHVSLFEGHRPLLPLDELPSAGNNANGSSRKRMPQTDSMTTQQNSEISDAKVSVNNSNANGANFLLDGFDFQGCQMETKPADDGTGTGTGTANGDGDCRFYDSDFWTDFPADFSDSCR